MKHHRHIKVVVLGAAVLLLAVVNASAKDAKTFNVPYAGMLGNARIEAGHYRISWDENAPAATVTVATTNGKAIVATTQGKIVERDTKYQANMVIYVSGENGSKVISELRIGGSNKAIVFEE